MSDKFSFRGGDPEGVPDGNYVITVAGGHVTGLSAAPAGSGGGASVAVDDEGVEVVAAATRLNFTGAGVTVTDVGAGEAQIDVAAAGGGGSSAWTQQLNLPLTSLTGWAAGTGTWAAQTDRITQSGTSSTADRLHYNTLYPISECVVECEIRIDSAPHAQFSRAGIFIGSPPSADGGGAQWVSLNSVGGSTASLDFEIDNVAEYPNIALAAPIPDGTWAKLRIHKSANFVDAYVNGAFVGTYELGQYAVQVRGRVGLKTYAAAASFRNFKVWTPALPT